LFGYTDTRRWIVEEGTSLPGRHEIACLLLCRTLLTPFAPAKWKGVKL